MMNNLDKYYQETIARIKKLVKEKNEADALELIQQELSSSYIPNKYIEEFEKLYMNVNRENNVRAIEEKYDSMTKKQLLVEAFDGTKIDVSVLSFFLVKFKNQLENSDFAYLNDIFTSKQINNIEKIFILEQFKQCEIDHEFDYYNKDIDSNFRIQTTSCFEFDAIEYWMFLCKDIENRLFKEPSLILMAMELARVIYENFFGTTPPFESFVLSEKLVNHVLAYFEPNAIGDNDFNVWMEKILSENKVLN